MSPKYTSQRKLLCRWASWFFFFNAVLILLIGLSCVTALPSFSEISFLNFGGEVLGVVFGVLAIAGQSTLLAFLFGSLALLLALLVPKRWFVMAVSIGLGSIVIFLMIADSIIYHLYQYHLTAFALKILVSGAFKQVIVLSPLEYLIAVFLSLVVFCLECLLAYWLWRYLLSHKRTYGWFVGCALSMSLLISYGIYFGAGYFAAHPKMASIEEQVGGHLVLMEGRTIPYYTETLLFISPRLRSRFFSVINNGFDIQNGDANQALQYPLKPLKYSQPKQPLNIVIIAIDTWRYDAMNSVVTPNIADFEKQSMTFTDNYSGGNSTQPGIFSLFYSLPSPYWSAMLKQRHGPVFIHQLLKEHYQLEVLGSAELNYPPFDKTVFREVPDLQIYMQGDDPQTRDANMTNEFVNFLKNRSSDKPFFGFLFYDAVHGYCQSDATHAKPFQPAVSTCDRIDLGDNSDPLPYINRYKNAVLYDDAEIGKVIKTLKSQGLLKNTVVIITADHGEEFNDEHLGYWGHASAFDPYQVRTPLIVYWPGKMPQTIYYQTSHYDIVPTLMQNVLDVSSPVRDYSVGHSLFIDKPPAYLIVGSYVDYAVLQPERTTIVYSGGDYNITYPSGADMPNAKIDKPLMQNVYRLLNRYYQ